MVFRGRQSKARSPAPSASVQEMQKEKSFEDKFWENYTPPSYVTNKYVWVAAAVVGSFLAYYSLIYKDCIPQ
jgi:hypothetical protein